MSKLISGGEAKKAWANKIPLEYTSDALGEWFDVNNSNTLGIFERSDFKFRLKPRTISINGVEVPAPFEPEEDMFVFILDDSKTDGYRRYDFEVDDTEAVFFGVWRTEEEIKQVVAALRSIFK